MRSIKTPRTRVLALLLLVVLIGTCALTAVSDASAAPGFTIRVSNSGAGGNPGYFYVGGPINVTVVGKAPAQTFQVCMTPLPIDRASCRHGRVGRTVETLGAPSKSGLTKLRVSFGPNKVYVRQIRVRKAA